MTTKTQTFRWQTEGKWAKDDGQLRQIAVADDDSLWGVNQKDDVYTSANPAAKWAAQKIGDFIQVDTKGGDLTVGITTGNVVQKKESKGWAPLPATPLTPTWVSIGSDGAVWITVNNGDIYHLVGAAWVKVEGATAIQVSVGNASHVWAVQSDGKIVYWNGKTWVFVAGSLGRVAVSGCGTRVAGTTLDEKPVVWTGTSWVHLPGTMKNISIAKNYLAGTNGKNEIYTWALGDEKAQQHATFTWTEDFKWVADDGKLVTVSIADDNSIWGVNAKGNPYTSASPTDKWAQQKGDFAQIETRGGDLTVGVTETHTVQKLENKAWFALAVTPMPAVWASIGIDATFWITVNNGDIYAHQNAAWVKQTGNAAQIAVANANNIWAVATNNTVSYWNGKVWANVAGSLARVAVNSDGTRVIGTTPDGHVVAYTGTGWATLPGSLKNVSIAKGHIIGSNAQQAIYYYKFT